MNASNKTIIEIALASDSNYLIPTTVLLKSLFENNKNNLLTINLLHLTSSTKEEDLLFWQQYTESHGHNFRKIPVLDEQLSAYPELRHTKSTYLRLLLPELLPEAVTKVLYLDADTIVLHDLSDLYKTDIVDYYAAAVKEVANCYAKTIPFFQSHFNKLGISPEHFYFGAGIMLMNLAKMRDNNVISQYFKFATEHPEVIIWSDQDILNAVLNTSIKYIHPKYNMNYDVEPDVQESSWSKKEVKEAKSDPFIIHYIGSIKPWNYLSYHPQTKLWWNYLAKTPFNGYKPQNKSVKLFFYKYYLRTYRMIDRNITLSKKRKIGKWIPKNVKKILKKK